MAVVKTDRVLPFEQLFRGAPFAATLTLYTKSNGLEDPKEHLFFKLNRHKAVTLDKKVTVHMLPNHKVTVCRMEKKDH